MNSKHIKIFNNFLTNRINLIFLITIVNVLLVVILLKQSVIIFSIIFIGFFIILSFPFLIRYREYILLLPIIISISGLTDILAKFYRPLLLLLLTILVFEYLRNNWNNFHWSQVHSSILLLVLWIIFSLLYTQDYLIMKRELNYLSRSIMTFFIISEYTIYSLKRKKIHLINIILITIILSSLLNFSILIYNFIKNPAIFSFQQNTTIMRTGGLFQDPNNAAMLMNTTFAISYSLLLKQKDILKKIFFLCCMLFFALGITFTYSRGGIIGLLIFSFFIFFQQRKSKFSLTFLVIFSILFLIFLYKPMMSRLSTISNIGSSRDISIYLRSVLLKMSINTISKNPFFGIGFGDFPELTTHYFSHHLLYYEGAVAHSIWLHITVELGIIGLVFYLLIYVNFFKMINKALKKINESNFKGYKYFINAIKYAVIIYFIPATFLSSQFASFIWIYLGLGNGICIYIVNGGLNDK